MDDKDVWLYSVIDHKNMSCEELQKVLDKWSNDPTPHELIVCDDKMIIKVKSGLIRSAYFGQQRATLSSGA